MTQVVIFGGTGQTGRAVAEALRERGATATPLSRADIGSAGRTLAAAEVAYLIAPNMYPDEPALIAQYLGLLRAAGTPRVVYHSVAAPYTPSMTHHVGKAISEDLVRQSLLEWTILQPCAYLQNFLPDDDDRIRVPFRPEAPFGLVDLADVGAAAAIVCLDRSYAGATLELGGPATVSVLDVARTAGAVLGREIGVSATTSAVWAERNRGRMPAAALESFVAMWDYYDAHGLLTGGRPLQAVLGRPATSLEQALARELGTGPARR